MKTITLTIINKLGLHARASAKFVSVAGRFQSEITVDFDGKSVNGKSIMAVMTLAATQGNQLTLHISGPDETDAAKALAQLIESRFGEAE